MIKKTVCIMLVFVGLILCSINASEPTTTFIEIPWESDKKSTGKSLVYFYQNDTDRSVPVELNISRWVSVVDYDLDIVVFDGPVGLSLEAFVPSKKMLSVYIMGELNESKLHERMGVSEGMVEVKFKVAYSQIGGNEADEGTR